MHAGPVTFSAFDSSAQKSIVPRPSPSIRGYLVDVPPSDTRSGLISGYRQDRLNRDFYTAEPVDYFDIRLLSLMLLAERPDGVLTLFSRRCHLWTPAHESHRNCLAVASITVIIQAGYPERRVSGLLRWELLTADSAATRAASAQNEPPVASICGGTVTSSFSRGGGAQPSTSSKRSSTAANCPLLHLRPIVVISGRVIT